MIDEKRIYELVEEINERKENADTLAATYRDVSALKELAKLVEEARPEGNEEIADLFHAYGFIAEQYETMGRFSVAAPFREEALRRLDELHGEVDFDDLEDMAYHLVKGRNFFVDDDCTDVYPVIRDLLGEKVADDMYEQVKAHRRTLKNDPVEMSEAYLEAIDEVEERIEENRTFRGMGSCYEIWDLKQQYLAEKGIDWTAPNMLNPGFHFD